MNLNQIYQDENLSENRNPSTTNAWGVAGTIFACPDCQSTFFVLREGDRSTCPLCLNSNLTRMESENSLVNTLTPELISPHKVNQGRINAAISTFSSGIPYPPEDLIPANLAARLIPVFLPSWLVDTSVKARWQAEMGFNYEVVSHRERFDQNAARWLSQEVKETRVGWEPRTGWLEREYPNVSTPAMENEKSLLAELGGFQQKDSQKFNSDLITQGAFIKLPTRIQSDAWNDAVLDVHREANEECRIAGGADYIRNYKWEPNFTKQNWTLYLRPVYATYYIDDDRNLRRVWLHGETGKISGIRKSSMKRAQSRALTILTIAAVLFFIGLVIAGIGLVFPPILIFGGLVLLAASLASLGALVPIVQSWQFNKST